VAEWFEAPVQKNYAYRGGCGTPGGVMSFWASMMLIFLPLAMIMSPGFWSAVQGPIHLAAIVMVLLAGVLSLCDVTVIV
jgi:hypothetical protein